MRIDEITVNIPITIDLDGGRPRVKVDGRDANDADGDQEPDQNPVMVPPLQQSIELQKMQMGKESPVIDKMTSPDELGDEPDDDEDSDPDQDPDDLDNLKTLAGLIRDRHSRRA